MPRLPVSNFLQNHRNGIDIEDFHISFGAVFGEGQGSGLDPRFFALVERRLRDDGFVYEAPNN